jgi:hypothetical protein
MLALVRPRWTVAGVAVSAALVLGALPGLAGSRTPSPAREVDAAAFQAVTVTATVDRSATTIDQLDRGLRSAGYVEATARFIERGRSARRPGKRPSVSVPVPASANDWKTPLSTLSGAATFYDNGTTAMRLPRGTIVVICGAAGCLERTVTDYGPLAPERIVDMYRPDFFAICGCPSWSGITQVTVKVYGLP